MTRPTGTDARDPGTATSDDIDEVDRIALPLNIVTSEIERIAGIVMRLRDRPPTHAVQASKEPTELLALAQSIYKFRRRRDRVFGRFAPDMFADPRWDMLLDLFIAAEQGRRISVSSVCIAATCPPTTALRHLSAMTKHELILRVNDHEDARKVWVELSHEAHEAVSDLLQSWR